MQENNSFFKKVGFYKEIVLNLSLDPDGFKKAFSQYTGSRLGSLGFGRQEKKLHGQIEGNAFNISVPMQTANSRSLLSGSKSFAVINGTFEEDGGILKVRFASFVPFTNFILFYGVLLALTIAFPLVTLTSETQPLLVKIIFNTGVVLMHVRVYLMFRNSVKELFNDTVDEFERWSR